MSKGHIESKESEEFEQIGSCTDFKPGQKFPTPAPANGDRVFYESLLSQNPKSEMAQEWCVSYGILSEKEAAKLVKIISVRKGKPIPVFSTTVKKESAAKKVEVKKTNKRTKLSSEDALVDTGIENSSEWEGSGTIGI